MFPTLKEVKVGCLTLIQSVGQTDVCVLTPKDLILCLCITDCFITVRYSSEILFSNFSIQNVVIQMLPGRWNSF